MSETILTTRPYPLDLQLNALCKCSHCGMVGRCTPALDFYVTDITAEIEAMDQDARDYALTGKPLTCANCFEKLLEAQGIKVEAVFGE